MARVAVDVELAHLDRPFDYLVPEPLAATAQPGVRVRVRFSGRLVDGYVVERLAASEHSGRLAFLDKVVSPEPVLAPEVLRLAREVADRYAGTLADVLRLAVPPRHARVEAATAEPVAAAGPRAGRRRCARSLPAGPATTPARPCWTPCTPAPRSGPSGRRCPARPGRTSWPGWSPPRWPPAAGPWWCCRTTATSTGSTPHCPRSSGPTSTSS